MQGGGCKMAKARIFQPAKTAIQSGGEKPGLVFDIHVKTSIA